MKTFGVFKKETTIQICNHCGRDVSWGSGLFVNRILDLNNVEIRIENDLKFPEGDFICFDCAQKSEDFYE